MYRAAATGKPRPSAMHRFTAQSGRVSLLKVQKSTLLRQARGVEQQQHDGDVHTLPPRNGGGVLAVHGAELGGVGRAPQEQEHEVVAEARVLVHAHDGEERVEHLVRHLRPPPATGRQIWYKCDSLSNLAGCC
ncbi:hypothetical protein SEVIR_7G338301v4 [Setaria viridis]